MTAGALLPGVLAGLALVLLAAAVRPAAPSRRPPGAGGRLARGRPDRRTRCHGASRRRLRAPTGVVGAPGAAGTDALLELLDELGRELRTGASLAGALERAEARRPDALGSGGPDASLVAHALAVAGRAGGPAAAALDRAAAVLRERRSWRAERRAQAAQARLGATVLTVVPLGFAAWSAAGSERVRDVYAASPVALALAALGLCLNAAGWWWMRRITEATAA